MVCMFGICSVRDQWGSAGTAVGAATRHTNILAVAGMQVKSRDVHTQPLQECEADHGKKTKIFKKSKIQIQK